MLKFYLTMRKHRKEWTAINEPLGKELGYPKCCIKSFCAMTPFLMRWCRYKHINISGQQFRYTAGCIDGKFTGFIPCHKHAKQILKNEITLHSLIKERNVILVGEFPFYGRHDI